MSRTHLPSPSTVAATPNATRYPITMPMLIEISVRTQKNERAQASIMNYECIEYQTWQISKLDEKPISINKHQQRASVMPRGRESEHFVVWP